METRCRNSCTELKRARAVTFLVTNLHWTMARRLLREFRDLTDLEFAELYAEANAERVRRFGPMTDLDFPDAAATETGPTPCEGRKFFPVSNLVHETGPRVAWNAEMLPSGALVTRQGNYHQRLCGLRRHLLLWLHDVQQKEPVWILHSGCVGLARRLEPTPGS